MLIIRKVKEHRFNAKHNHEIEEELRKLEYQSTLPHIPESNLPGISALPIELWSIIVEIVVEGGLKSKKCRSYPKCYQGHTDFRLRLVCRVFDVEVQYAFHKHIVLPRFPYGNVTRGPKCPELNMMTDHLFHDALLASAIYNSCTSPSTPKRFSKPTDLQFIDRINNCTLIAQNIDEEHSTSYAQDLTRVFANAASTSQHCWNYLFAQHTNRRESYGYTGSLFWDVQDEVNLELALLAASGYEIEEVKDCMIRLAGARRANKTLHLKQQGKMLARYGRQVGGGRLGGNEMPLRVCGGFYPREGCWVR